MDTPVLMYPQPSPSTLQSKRGLVHDCPPGVFAVISHEKRPARCDHIPRNQGLPMKRANTEDLRGKLVTDHIHRTWSISTNIHEITRRATVYELSTVETLTGC
jgi:hypothetical protein